MSQEPRGLIRKKKFNCPCCGQRISMVLDLSAASQRYVEDCEVCCNPLEVTFLSEDGELLFFDVREAQ